MEKKLAKYRAEQEKLEKIKLYRYKVKKLFSFFASRKPSSQTQIKKDENQSAKNTSTSEYVRNRAIMKDSEDLQNLLPVDEVISLDETESLCDDSLICCSWLQLLYYLLCFIFWGTLYIVFIKLEFGTVYFISSALILMYLNTNTDPRKSGELSAYSVFNKDCISIDGTLKAEQFEREIMFGPGSVR
ncbi:hypothetical protein WA026_018665 [Henosepilachna vigintioctopunctata]|uniref:SAYSvFN domain-containing protein n=1 Tax=Henosepilachna vigintioctopunctata TaxID=420089 RepID=A0AAW1UCB2_9CUCU